MMVSSIQLPKENVKLSAAETVTDVDAFVSSHLSMVKANNGNPVFRPYLERLIEFIKLSEARKSN
jgi:hypothetical protein